MSKVNAERISAARTSTEKEAKALATELSNLLSKKDPWNQDVVFAREKYVFIHLAIARFPASPRALLLPIRDHGRHDAIQADIDDRPYCALGTACYPRIHLRA